MNLSSKRNIKNLFRKYRILPSKRLGQNFLVDGAIIKKIIRASQLKPEDLVLEIGPGVGNLTQEMAKRVRKVIAVEKDPRMVEILKKTLKDVGNVEVIQEDIRKIQKSKIKNQNDNSKFKIIGNLPFYLTAPVIRKFLECNETRPRFMVLVVQKEVGQRICARPPDMNLLAVSVQFYAEPKIISYISKSSFWPVPKVDGAIIKITPIDSNKIFACAFSHRASQGRAQAFRILFFRIVRAGFSQPRKMLVNNLAKKLRLDKEGVKAWLLKNNIQPSQRAETLNIEDWLKLTKNFKCLGIKNL